MLLCSPVTPDPLAYTDDAKAEAQLRAFDLDSKYGGCIGLTRLERCAQSLATCPPSSAAQLM